MVLGFDFVLDSAFFLYHSEIKAEISLLLITQPSN